MANMEDRDPSYWNGMEIGAAPPPKIIWQNWSDEQKKASGLPTFDDWHAAAQRWRERFNADAGGDIGINQLSQEFSLANILGFDATREQFIEAMNRIGLFDRHEEGKARYNQLLGAFDGNYVSGGGYHWGPNGTIIDVATSDENVRGIARPNDMGFVQQSGLKNALPNAMRAAELFPQWTSLHGGVKDANGNFINTDTGQSYDAFGNPINAGGGLAGYSSFIHPELRGKTPTGSTGPMNSYKPNVTGTPTGVAPTSFSFSDFLQSLGLGGGNTVPERTSLKPRDTTGAGFGGWKGLYGGFWNPDQKLGKSPLKVGANRTMAPTGIKDPFTTNQTNKALNSTWGLA